MISISKDELNQLEVIGCGKFGTVYKKDESIAYKIYHSTIYDDLTGIKIDNPSLLLSPFHFKKLISKSKKLEYSGGVLDTIYLDGKFGGVVIPYYNGDSLSKFIDASFAFKIDLSRKLVQNAKELTSQFIYPFDYRLDNVILEHNQIRIIDIDDVKTHVCMFSNPLYRAFSINSLSTMIQVLFRQYDHSFVNSSVKELLDREKSFSAIQYQKIEEYIQQKEKKIDVLFFHFHSDLKKVYELSNTHDLKCILVLENSAINKQELLKEIHFLQEQGISLYDVVTPNKIDDYPTIENTRDMVLLSEEKQEFIPVYQKKF